MKITINILLIVLLSSCGINTNKQKESNDKETTSYKKQNKDKLLGDWGIYSHIVNGVVINCNVCPRIIFNDMNIAILTLPSRDQETYKWSETNNTLKIEFVGEETSEPYLSDSEYEIKFEQKEKFINLTMHLSEYEHYILTK